MKELIASLEEKIEKHESKLKAHVESEAILQTEQDTIEDKNCEKYERLGEKLLSTIKNIEYHTATSKSYQKVIAMLKQKE